jgi:LysR family transcriptional regulator, glycine cleavage system transcriptional activator
MPVHHRSLPSTAALRAFEAAARLRSFTDAAAELGQTQGAVSHQIRELETRLGVRLFERQARGIVPTEPGKTYLPFVNEALDRLRAGADALQPSRDDRVLTVSCSPNFASKWLVPRLGDFIAAHPDIDLRISASLQHVGFDGDGIDLAIRHGDGDWPHLDVTQLCRELLFPICSPHLMPSRLGSVDALAGHTLIHDRDRKGWTTWLTAVGAAIERFDLQHGPVFSQTSLAIDAAVAGQGIALARSALASLDLDAGRLIRPVRIALPATFAYWIVCPKPHAKRPKIERFRQWLLAEVASDPVAKLSS